MKIMHLRTDNGPVGTLVDNDGALGVAVCSPKDRFSKKVGVKIALGRSNKTLFSLEKVPNRTVTVQGSEISLCDLVANHAIYLRSKSRNKVTA